MTGTGAEPPTARALLVAIAPCSRFEATAETLHIMQSALRYM